mgnify:FL=1
MKKLLISILIALLLILSIFIAVNGLNVGKIEVLGIRGINQKNSELDQKIQQATQLSTIDYQKAVDEVEENSKKLTEEKKNYEDMALLNTDSEGQATAQLQKYEVEALWVKLGNHATSEGATMKMDIVRGSSTSENMYDLNFTVNGSYISIIDFISDIENDSTLGFKIENFHMSGSGDSLQATFVCKEISIIDVNESQVDTGTNNNNTTNSTTNSTNNTNSTNTTSNSATNTNVAK